MSKPKTFVLLQRSSICISGWVPGVGVYRSYGKNQTTSPQWYTTCLWYTVPLSLPAFKQAVKVIVYKEAFVGLWCYVSCCITIPKAKCNFFFFGLQTTASKSTAGNMILLTFSCFSWMKSASYPQKVYYVQPIKLFRSPMCTYLGLTPIESRAYALDCAVCHLPINLPLWSVSISDYYDPLLLWVQESVKQTERTAGKIVENSVSFFSCTTPDWHLKFYIINV